MHYGRVVALWIVAAATCALACAQNVPATAPAPPSDAPATAAPAVPPAVGVATAPAVDPRADRLLDALQKRDDTLKDFTAKLRSEVVHSRTLDTETQFGTFDYVKGPAGRKFAAQFDKSSVDGAKPRTIDQKITFDGEWLTIRDVQKMLFVREQLAPPGKPYDPFKLGQGQFPIPIGQDKKDILREFTVTVAPPDAAPGADPAPDPRRIPACRARWST